MENNTEEELIGCELTMLRGKCYLEHAGAASSNFFLVEEKSLKSPPPPNANKKTNTGVTLGGFVIDCVGGKMLPQVSGASFFQNFTFLRNKFIHTQKLLSALAPIYFYIFEKQVFTQKTLLTSFSVISKR